MAHAQSAFWKRFFHRVPRRRITPSLLCQPFLEQLETRTAPAVLNRAPVVNGYVWNSTWHSPFDSLDTTSQSLHATWIPTPADSFYFLEIPFA